MMDKKKLKLRWIFRWIKNPRHYYFLLLGLIFCCLLFGIVIPVLLVWYQHQAVISQVFQAKKQFSRRYRNIVIVEQEKQSILQLNEKYSTSLDSYLPSIYADKLQPYIWRKMTKEKINLKVIQPLKIVSGDFWYALSFSLYFSLERANFYDFFSVFVGMPLTVKFEKLQCQKKECSFNIVVFLLKGNI